MLENGSTEDKDSDAISQQSIFRFMLGGSPATPNESNRCVFSYTETVKGDEERVRGPSEVSSGKAGELSEQHRREKETEGGFATCSDLKNTSGVF